MSTPTRIQFAPADLAPRFLVAPEVVTALAQEVAGFPWVESVEVGEATITCTLTVPEAAERLRKALERPRLTVRRAGDEPGVLVGIHLDPGITEYHWETVGDDRPRRGKGVL